MALVLALAMPGRAAGEGEDSTIVGGQTAYTVRKGDSLALIGARFGVDPVLLASANGHPRRLQPGQVLAVDNRHIVPFFLRDGILVNVPQRMLFLFRDGALVSAYPVGVGRPDWPTPTGEFPIQELRRHPTWHVPVSIQEEMRREGKKVVTRVDPGPENPLGDYWISLQGSGCGIHGTNAPASVYAFRTHGCIRLHPDDVAELFPRVSVGMTARVIYEPVLLAEDGGGGVFLEVHRDVYRRSGDAGRAVEQLAVAARLAESLDRDLVDGIVRGKQGIARRVDRREEERLGAFTSSSSGPLRERVGTTAQEESCNSRVRGSFTRTGARRESCWPRSFSPSRAATSSSSGSLGAASRWPPRSPAGSTGTSTSSWLESSEPRASPSSRSAR